MNEEEKIREIFKRLNEVYTVRTFLDHDPYKVLVRTILSQRTRDEADAPVEEVQKLIKPAGFYRVKAGRIQEVSRILIDQYGGEVPNDMDELLTLPGVGRKTANCVFVFAFREAAIPVDTHVHRISNRWGIADTKKPEDTEFVLMEKVPKDLWVDLNDLMVQFGQTICRPIGPQCDICPLTDLCQYDGEDNEK